MNARPLVSVVIAFVVGVFSTMYASPGRVPEAVAAESELNLKHSRPIPDGKWDILELVKGFDGWDGKPIYWAIAQKIREEVIRGQKVDIRFGKVELLQFPREQIGDSPDDRSVDHRLLSRTITIEVKDGIGRMTVTHSKNST